MVINLPSNAQNIDIENPSNYNFSELADWLFSLSGTDFVVIGTVAAILISSNLNLNQQNSIGNFFDLVGEAILTFNAQEITRRSKYTNPHNLSIEDLNRKINFLYNELMKIKREP